MPLDLQHPMITQIEKTGYPNLMEKPEHAGFDVYNKEILSGDEIVMDGSITILKDNLERYLAEYYDFTFQTIE